MEFLLGFLLLLALVVACILAYRKLRPLFPVQVNCWFCNHDTKVPYGNKNCWDCPKCEQYNGFTPEGDYNKPVPAQYTEDINHPVNCDPAEFLTRGHYLCHTCQRNQLLKIKQLAAFEPLNEATYDDEIAFYKQHLESVYALCLSCDAVVKREIERLDSTLSQQKEVSQLKNSPLFSDNFSETASAVQKIGVNLNQVILPFASLATAVCALWVLSSFLYRFTPQTLQPWMAHNPAVLVHEFSVCLCGLTVCILSKLLLGKGRLYLGDAVHILLWLGVLLVSVFHTDLLFLPITKVAVGLVCLLVGLELILALKRRQPTNATSPIIKRLSLEGCASSTNSEAASEAVSSVSTSCRGQLDLPAKDAGDGPALFSSGIFHRETATPGGNVYGLSPNTGSGKVQANDAQKDDLDELRQELGASCFGFQSSDSGYSTGKSSLFGHNPFGKTTEPRLSAGVQFPRPLISPARLNVVSFSPSVSDTNKLRSRQHTHTSLFSNLQQQNQIGSSGRDNIFLTRDSRPLSMFSANDRVKSNFSSKEYMQTPHQHRPRESSTLFSQMTGSVPHLTKTSSEVDLSLHTMKSKCSTTTTWWRDSATDIVDNRMDELPDKENILKDNLKQSELSVPTECDSTTPCLSKLKISSLAKKKKKVKSFHKQRQSEVVDSVEFSDDEGESLFLDHSSVSTKLLQQKHGWPWLQWTFLAVIIVSVATNLFLAWTVWSAR